MADSHVDTFQARCEKYGTTLPKKIDDLADAVESLLTGNGSLDNIFHMAHKLAGTSGTFGFLSISHAVSELESLCSRIGKGPIHQGRDYGQQLCLLMDEIQKALGDKPVVFPEYSDDIAKEGFGLRALVVDDDPSVANYTRHLLTSLGVYAAVQTVPLRVLDHMSEFNPDLVLLDLYMPDRNGMDLVLDIRSMRKFDRTALVFISSEDDQAIIKKAKAAGAEDFLAKPVSKSDLAALIRKLTRDKQGNHIRNIGD